LLVATELRTLMDQRLRADGLTTQQAALVSVVEALGTPSITEAATALGTTHQNVRRIADALSRKGHLRIDDDARDRRTRRLAVTEQSGRHWRRRSRSDQQAVLDWFTVLGDADADTLFALLLRLEQSLRAELA
jgi:DNA-binding MarR family transcriptional regulator